MKVTIETIRTNIRGHVGQEIPIEIDFNYGDDKGDESIWFYFNNKQSEFFAIDIKSAVFLAENILKLIELNNAKP